MSTQRPGRVGVAVWDQGEIKIIVPPRAKRIAGRRWQKIVREIVYRDQGICWLCGHVAKHDVLARSITGYGEAEIVPRLGG